MATLEDLEPIISGMKKGQTLEQYIASWGEVPISDNMSALAERVICFLQQNTPLTILKYYKGGAVGKGSFLTSSSSDAMLVVVLGDLRSVQEMTTKTRSILHTIKAKLDSRSWHDGQITFHESDSVQSLRFETYFAGIDVRCTVDICPVFDALRNKTLTDLYKEMMHCSKEDREMYGLCFTQKQVDFIKQCPYKVRQLMILLKDCFKKEEFVTNVTPTVAYFLEVLAASRWHNARKPRDFSLSEWFEEIMGQLVDLSSLNIVWEHEFTASRYWQLPSLPIVLDPVNPFKNLAPPRELHASIKKHARDVLRRMTCLKQYLNEGPKPVLRDMRRGQNLQQFIAETIEPDSHFRRRCVEVVDKMKLFLQHQTEFNVSMVIKSGSLGKSTNIQGKSDVDMVVFINSLASVQDQQRKMEYMLDTLEQDLRDKWTGRLELVRRTQYSLQYKLSCGETGHLHDVDILPACDILKDKTIDRVHSEMLTRSKTEREFYNVCFTKKQVEFVKEVPIKVKNLIRLVKYWAKTELNTEEKKIATSYFLECLVMYYWIEWRSPDDFNTNDRFKEVMTELARISSMRVVWPRRYTVSRLFNVDVMYPGGVPIFLDPCNPFKNLAPFDKNKGLVAKRARLVLQKIEDMRRYRTGQYLDN